MAFAVSSVECGERGQRYFRFALRSLGEALLVKKGGVFGLLLGVFGSQKSRTSREMAQKQEGGQSEAEFGSDLAFIYIYTIERTFVLAYLINIYIELPSKIYGLHIAPNQAKSTEFV